MSGRGVVVSVVTAVPPELRPISEEMVSGPFRFHMKLRVNKPTVVLLDEEHDTMNAVILRIRQEYGDSVVINQALSIKNDNVVLVTCSENNGITTFLVVSSNANAEQIRASTVQCLGSRKDDAYRCTFRRDPTICTANETNRTFCHLHQDQQQSYQDCIEARDRDLPAHEHYPSWWKRERCSIM